MSSEERFGAGGVGTDGRAEDGPTSGPVGGVSGGGQPDGRVPDGSDPRRAADAAGRGTRVRAARGARYGKGTGYRAVAGPPMPDPSAPPRKSKVHSILSALPVIMLVSGLYFYYSGESEQSAGGPILAESVEVSAVFEGLSVVRSGGDGRHYLWFDDAGRRRGARIPPARRAALDGLEPGDELRLRLAPTVSGSRTLWAWRVEHEGTVLVDDAARLR